jgi:hypothetical protein
VTCLANLGTKDGLILYAGINSSEEDCLAGKNQHFRAFEVVFPKKSKTAEKDAGQPPKSTIQYLNKTALFKPFTSPVARKEGYQGIVRLSPPKRSASGSKRIGAVASRFARDENEIVVFNATTSLPTVPGDIIERISPHKGQEAHDIDILEPEEGQFKLTYCTDFDVYVDEINYDFSKKRIRGKSTAVEKKYTIPHPDTFDKKSRAKIRFVRWLSPSHLLLLVNLPNKSGAELQVLRLYGDTMGSITLRKRLPSHVKAVVDMDVSILDPDEKGAYQIVVAVAGNDISTTVLTIDYYGTASNTLSRFHNYTTFRDVHPQGITKLVFSPFLPPSSNKAPADQYLRLASTSYGNTVVVDTFTLEPVSDRPGSRHVLSSAKARALRTSVNWFVGAFVVLVLLLLTQGLFDPEGNWTKDYVPTSVRNTIDNYKRTSERMSKIQSGRANLNSQEDTPAIRAQHRLSDFLHRHRHTDNESPYKAVVVQHDPDTGSLSTQLHHGGEEALNEETEAKKWEDLSHEEKSHWKEKLVQAGAWAVDEGETVLKGIFFGQMGGLVGEVAQGILNG